MFTRPRIGSPVFCNLTSGELRALKRIKKKHIKRRLLEREIEIMKACEHPHILRLYDVLEEEKHMSLVLELVQGGELFNRIVDRGAFSEIEAVEILRQILGT